MQLGTGRCAALRFSSSEIPEGDRLSFCREVFGQQIVRLDVEPSGDHAFHFDAELRLLPGLRFVHYAASPGRLNRSKAIVSDGDDDLAFFVNLEGQCAVEQRGRIVILEPGDAVAIAHVEPGLFTHADCRWLALVIPRSAIAGFLPNVEDAAARLIPQESDALRLLRGYLGLLRQGNTMADPEIGRLAASHIYDLIALALGATQDGGAIARGRGMAAARLHAIKRDILRNLEIQDLSVATIATAKRVTPRYVQYLFENEGTTFTQYLLGMRLDRAHRLLANPRHAGRRIAAIAYAAGFGDLSYFNRAFRRCYGQSPSELRAEALDGQPPRRETAAE